MTSHSLFNEHWYRVRKLTPRLAPDVQISRHVYRKQPHYILRRSSTRRWHRMSASAFEMLARFDGQQSVEQVWQFMLASQGDQAPTQGDVMSLLAQLHDADMLVVESELDLGLLLDRQEKHQQRDLQQRFWNPLNIRIAIADPDRFITTLNSYIPRNCLAFLILSIVVLLCSAVFALAPQSQRLMEHLNNNTVFDPANLLMMAVIYPLMKLLHELSHALVVKRYGGDVRECGVAMLVLFPNPYVDASAASFFTNKYHRILVSAAGILAELSVASLAAFVWLSTTGLLRDAALSVMLIGAVSTLLFNGNPLLKFDAYYMLSDWLEIPNLAMRSRKFLQFHMATLVGFDAEPIPVPSDKREQAWLIGYSVLAMVYRLVLMAFIAWMISGQYFFFGLLLAGYIVVTSFFIPIWKALKLARRQTKEVRVRFALGAGLVSLLLTGAAFAMPVSDSMTTDGIVWLPEHSVLRLEQPCEVVRVHVQPGQFVDPGQPLFDCSDEDWLYQVRVLKAELRRLDARRAGLLTQNPVEHKRLTAQRRTIEAQYKLAETRLAATRVVASARGQFLIEGSTSMAGRYLAANAIAAYVVPDNQRTIRLALTQTQARLTAHGQAQVDVYVSNTQAGHIATKTEVQRQTPKATSQLSVVALTTLGGGTLRASPAQAGATVEYPVFDLELAWPEDMPMQMIGSRLRVRITHKAASLRHLLMNHWRQLLQERAST